MGKRSRSVLGGTIALALLAGPAVLSWPYWRLGLLLLLCILAAWIAVHDLATLTIPDEAVLGIALVALLAMLGEKASLREIALAVAIALASAAALFALCEAYARLRGFDVLGFGDIKLAAASAFLVGPFGLSQQLLLASVAALVFVAIRLLRRRRRLRVRLRLPFGTFLAPSLVMVWAWTGLQP